MQNHFLRFGLLFGLISIGLILVFYFLEPSLIFSALFGLISTIFIIILMRQSVHNKRTDQNGNITFKDAFRESWLTYVVAVTIVTLFSFILTSYIDETLHDVSIEAKKEALITSANFLKLPEERLEAQLIKIENEEPNSLGKTIFNLFINFIFGAFISLIIAFFLKKEDKESVFT